MTPSVQWDVVASKFKELLVEDEGTETQPVVDLEDILSGKISPPASFETLPLYVSRLGLTLASSPTGHAFVNGKHYIMDEVRDTYLLVNPLLTSAIRASYATCSWRPLNKHNTCKNKYRLGVIPIPPSLIAALQVYSGKLTDDSVESMSNYFYDLPSSTKRRNRHIIPGSAPGSLRIFNLPEIFSQTDFKTSASSFIYTGASDSPLPLQND
jgi:UDP-glucose:glycoprotein glucosyltransferase